MTAEGFSPTGIRFQNIDKRYGGLYALRHVSLDVAPGECVVFAGRNGSGKTTLLRIAAGLVRASSGKVSFIGLGRDDASAKDGGVNPALQADGVRAKDGGVNPPPQADGLKAKDGGINPLLQGDGVKTVATGLVAHATMVYDELTAQENLVLFARLQGIAEPEARAEKLLGEVGLLERRGSLVRTFSRGMRQRVAIARALLNEPSVLFLDEPATGLDPQGITWLAESLRRTRDAGRTILMSLHGESEISALATRAVRLDGGAVVADTKTGASLHSILTFGGA